LKNDSDIGNEEAIQLNEWRVVLFNQRPVDPKPLRELTEFRFLDKMQVNLLSEGWAND
jgi:hypothetical protein